MLVEVIAHDLGQFKMEENHTDLHPEPLCNNPIHTKYPRYMLTYFHTLHFKLNIPRLISDIIYILI